MSWRPTKTIRPIALALIRRSNEILVAVVRDDSGAITGWRPLGGGIEFGEPAEDALTRELFEELGERVVCRSQLCVMENIYRHEGFLGHEIVFVFDAFFSTSSAYTKDSYSYRAEGLEHEVMWRKVRDFLGGTERLFPDGLVKHLTAF